MDREFQLLRVTRKNTLGIVEGLSEDSLLKIPTNSNNNIFWNFAHSIVTQQLLCYKMSGVEMVIDNQIIDLYRKGSKPGNEANLSHVEMFKKLCFETADKIEVDYNSGVFEEFKTYQTSYGFELTSIEDAIKFNNSHEAMHLGYMLAMRRYI